MLWILAVFFSEFSLPGCSYWHLQAGRGGGGGEEFSLPGCSYWHLQANRVLFSLANHYTKRLVCLVELLMDLQLKRTVESQECHPSPCQRPVQCTL